MAQRSYSNRNKIFNNWNVCYSHGFDVNDNCNLTTCGWRKMDHQEGFTCKNEQGYIDTEYDTGNDTKVLLALLDGWHKARNRILLPHTHFFCHTITNCQRATGMQLSTHYITFTIQSIMDLCLRPRRKSPSTHSCHFPHSWILKHTPVPSHHPPISTIVSPPIAMLAGAPNLAMPFRKASSSLYSNFAA